MKFKDMEPPTITPLPSHMIAEFINPDGARYNFECIMIKPGLAITLTNETGHQLRLIFTDHPISEREFPLDKKAMEDYQNLTLTSFHKAQTGTPTIMRIHGEIYKIVRSIIRLFRGSK